MRKLLRQEVSGVWLVTVLVVAVVMFSFGWILGRRIEQQYAQRDAVQASACVEDVCSIVTVTNIGPLMDRLTEADGLLTADAVFGGAPLPTTGAVALPCVPELKPKSTGSGEVQVRFGCREQGRWAERTCPDGASAKRWPFKPDRLTLQFARGILHWNCSEEVKG